MSQERCKITLDSYQRIGNEHDESHEIYEGTYMDRGDKKYVSYKRQQDGDVCSVLICFDGNEMTLSQSGALNSKLRFVEGQTTINDYGTPIGVMKIGVETKSYKVLALQGSVRIKLQYVVEGIETRMEIGFTLA